MNQIFNLELGVEKMKAQEQERRRYGGEAYPFYGKVYACPSDDPKHEYSLYMDMIEEAAGALGVDIEPKRKATIWDKRYARQPVSLKYLEN